MFAFGTNLTPPHCIEVYVPSKEHGLSCTNVCVLAIYILPISSIFYWIFELLRQCAMRYFLFLLYALLILFIFLSVVENNKQIMQ